MKKDPTKMHLFFWKNQFQLPFQILGYIQLFHTNYELERFSACEFLAKLLDIYPAVMIASGFGSFE